MTNNEKSYYFIMATAVLLVLAIPIGIANIYLGYYIGESPCTACWFERIGMVVVGCLGICILRYGPKIKYIATILLFACGGLYMAGRHVGVFWGADIGMGQADMLLGAHTYVWSFVVYWTVILFTGLTTLFITTKSELMKRLADPVTEVNALTPYAKVVVILSFLVICSNAFQAFFLNGIPPFTGKHSPDRFSMNLAMMSKTWTAEVWTRFSKFSMTGKAIQTKPYIVGVHEPEEVVLNQPFSDGALNSSGTITVVSETPIALDEISSRTKYPIAGVAMKADGSELAFTTQELGLFYTDPDAKKVNGFVVFDKPNGYDMKYVIGDAFVGDKAIISAFNKTLVGVQKGVKMDPVKEWQFFRETSGDIGSVFPRNRPLLRTIRGYWEFVNSVASDGKYLYMVTLANKGDKNVVLSKFDTADWKLSAEANLIPAPGVQVKEGHSLNDYYVTGLTCYDGKILALSPRYNTLLVIDPQTAGVEKAYEVQGLSNPRSIFVRDGKLNVLDYKDGKNSLVQMNMPQITPPPAPAPAAPAPEAVAPEAPAPAAEAPEAPKPEA